MYCSFKETCYEGNLDDIKKIFKNLKKSKKCCIGKTDCDEKYCLMNSTHIEDGFYFACKAEKIDICQFLLENGMDNYKYCFKCGCKFNSVYLVDYALERGKIDDDGIISAFFEGNYEVIEYLFSKGIINIEYLKSPLPVYYEYNMTIYKYCIEAACVFGKDSKILEFLLGMKCEIDIDYNLLFDLTCGNRSSCVGTLKVLCENGVNNFNNGLSIAVDNYKNKNYENIINFLIVKGATNIEYIRDTGVLYHMRLYLRAFPNEKNDKEYMKRFEKKVLDSPVFSLLKYSTQNVHLYSMPYELYRYLNDFI